MEEQNIKLTKLTKCAGCGAKVGAGVLAQLLEGIRVHHDPNLLVGFDKSDDASVYKINDELALVQTVDFFPPIADDPYLFGQIAATNALSDVYAMGGVPKLCLNIMAVPEDMPDDVAILSEPFAVGYHVMMTSKIQKGDTVFISGGAAVGLYIAIFARAWGASRVIVSEINEPRRQFVESMGIETINPAEKDAMELMREVTDGGFDVVFDTSGAPGPTLMMPDLCRCGGKMMSLNLSGDEYKFIIGKVSFKEQTLIGNRLYTQEEFELGTKFVADNWRELGLDRMVTDRLPLSDIEKALHMMLNGENICKIVINCQQ